jgi:integrase/recombinase XerC/integrase/recombinase XerD
VISAPRRLGNRPAPRPGDVRYPQLRRYAAYLSSRRVSPATLARALAAIRAFYRMLVEHGEVPANPADLLGAPKLPRAAPADPERQRRRRAAGPDPDDHAAGDPRPAPLRARVFGGLRAEELISLDVASIGFDAETVRVEGKGAQDQVPARRRAGPAGDRPLSGARRVPRC